MKKRLIYGVLAGLLMAGAALATDGSWTGYITDNMCGAKGADAKHADCAEKCVKEHGAKYALVTDSDKKVYILDPQDSANGHAGHHVTVKGTIEGDTLKVSGIEMVK
jgi:Protein of unknown function (DUF5818)